VVGFLLVFCSAAWGDVGEYRLSTLSTRPDMVSGGDVLVSLQIPITASIQKLSELASVQLNGLDVTLQLRPTENPHRFYGLLSGLKLGANELSVYQRDIDQPVARLALKNHPVSGPVFSGPQEQPFICQTSSFALPDGRLLGPPLDENCSANTVVTYLYRSVEGGANGPLKPLPSAAAVPADVDSIKTREGLLVPYIVRVETGTINRAIYQIAVLHNPVADSEPDAFFPPKSWNKRLLFSFGGGCTGGWFKQGLTTGMSMNAVGPGSLTDAVLRAGYAYASSTLNVFGNNCQDVTAAETMMMVKEHFIERYGVPAFTFGRGGSGGAYQQIQIADNYPGLLDGIIPSATFPDVLATVQYLVDAELLHKYYLRAGDSLTHEQKRVIAGVGVLESVTRVSAGAGRINPRTFCPPELPEPLRYHPVSNPAGARCDVFDHTINVYGRNPKTGFAFRPVDNVGVQYGLSALQAGVINTKQFLDLNEFIGGYDYDGNLVPERAVADLEALRAAYSTGRVTNGGGGLKNVPIIDLRGYLDSSPNGDLHMKYHSFGLRGRLVRANGSSANHVMLITATGVPGMEEFTIAKMDEWLTQLVKSPEGDRSIDRIAEAKPADLSDSCYAPGGKPIVEFQTFGNGACNKLFPTYPSPRMMAGGPVTNDVLKCQLKPVDFREYRTSFSAEEKQRLARIFPGGVCDWRKPGVEQRRLRGVWLSHGKAQPASH
jgi:hypothetical protein